MPLARTNISEHEALTQIFQNLQKQSRKAVRTISYPQESIKIVLRKDLLAQQPRPKSGAELLETHDRSGR